MISKDGQFRQKIDPGSDSGSSFLDIFGIDNIRDQQHK